MTISLFKVEDNQIFFVYNAAMSSQKQILGRRRIHTMEIEELSQNNSKLHEKGVEQFLPFMVEEELDLNLEKYSRQIKEEIRFILLDLLRYPSSGLAQRHRSSNRLGNFDLKQIKNKNTRELQYDHSSHAPEICADCGLAVQESSIPLCSSVWQYPKAGVSVYYLFENVKMLSAQIFILGLFFAILALYTSIVEPTDQFTILNLPKKLSYSAKMQYSSTNSILTIILGVEAWAIFFSILIWWFMQFCVQSMQQKYVRMVDQEYLSASDFTIMLQDVPVGFTKERLQNQFNVYFDSLVYHHNLKKNWGQNLKPFEIQRITQVHPFGLSESDIMDQQLQGLDRDIVEKRKLLAQWMRQFKQNSRFSFQRSDRRREYDNLERMLERRRIKILKMEVKAREQYRLPHNKNLKTTFFVTFKFNQSAHIIEDINPPSIPAKLRYFFSCCRTAQYLTVRDDSSQTITIPVSRAPDPEDLIWGNLKVPLLTRFLWRLLTWGVIAAFLGTTFGICYGFNKLGVQSGLSIMPLVISVILTLLNMTMKFAIRQLSFYERDETESDRQRGILIKCLIALPANWLFTPLVLSIAVNGDFYGANGIIYFIFFLSLTNSFLPPLLRFFDPTYLYHLIRICWISRPYKKLELRQSELNELYQNEDYEIGWVYVYFIELFYFTCTFAPMVPAVIPITLLGYLVMFWVEKHCLLRRSTRPPKKSKTLLTTAQTAILLGPLILGFFGFIWVCIPRQDYSSIAFIGYMTLMGLGALYFLTPFRGIFKCLFAIPEEELMTYEEARQGMGSEYEQLNPLTSEIGKSELQALQIRKREEDRLTALNRSEDNLLEHIQINQIIEGLTKIPNIFGRNQEISKKIDRNDMVLKSRVRKEKQEVVFVSPPQNDTIQKELFDQEQPAKNEDQMSRAMTEQKAVVNYSSSGNTYARRNQVERRKAISVMREGSYDAVVETQSQSK